MKKKILRFVAFGLLLIFTNKNLFTVMAKTEIGIIDLPNELISYIINKIIDFNSYKKSIKKINNIFDYYLLKIENPEDCLKLAFINKQFKDHIKANINLIKQLKENKKQELINQIRFQYQGLPKAELEKNLVAVLNSTNYKNFKENLKEVAKLIIAGANVNIKNKYGSDALILATKSGSIELVKLLIENGADLKTKDANNIPVLILAIRNRFIGIAKFLIKKLDYANIKYNKDRTALMLAAKRGQNSIVKELILKVEDKYNNCNRALIQAASSGQVYTVNLLIENGANIESKDDNGNTPLILATLKGCFPTVKLLADKGANIDAVNNHSSTALRYAIKNDFTIIIKFLINKGAYIDNKDNIIKTTQQKYLIANKPHCFEKLINAISYGDKKMVKDLINFGIDINQNCTSSGETPLIVAASKKKDAIVKILIKNGADINKKDRWGWTALKWIIYTNNLYAAELLIDKGINIDDLDLSFTGIISSEIIKLLKGKYEKNS